MNKKIKFIIITAVCVVIIMVAIYIITPKSYLVLNIAPKDTILSIDGNKSNIDNIQTITVSPGNHKITISRDEFTTYSTDINIAKDSSLKIVAVLKPLTEKAQKILNSSPSNILEEYSANKMSTDINKYLADYPIIKILPIQARLYSINTCPSKTFLGDTSKIAICINGLTQPGYDLRPYIVNQIKSYSYNLDDYEVIWNIK